MFCRADLNLEEQIAAYTKVAFLLTNLNPDFVIRNLIFRSIKE